MRNFTFIHLKKCVFLHLFILKNVKIKIIFDK